MSLHSGAAGACMLADPEWRRKTRRVGWWLFVPVLGWPAALGYRALFVRRLLAAEEPLLPEVNGTFWRSAREGLCAISVIFGWLAPLYALLAVVLWSRGYRPSEVAVWLSLFYVCYPIFSTLSLPVACALVCLGDSRVLPLSEGVAFALAWAAVVFTIPAGFLEVSRTGRYAAAFAIWRTLPALRGRVARYGEAWFVSGLMGLCGHLCVPLSPWGVVWCYQGIVLLFNELLLAEAPRPGTWLARLCAGPPRRPARLGRSSGVDAAGAPVRFVDLWWFSAPLPRRRARS